MRSLFILLLLLPNLAIADDFGIYYGLHTIHAKLSQGKAPDKNYENIPTNNENKLLGIRYKNIAASTYINSQNSDIRNYTLSYEFDYFGIGAVYGYDEHVLSNASIKKETYKPTILPMAYAKIPIYSITTNNMKIGIQSIFMINALNTGLTIEF